jgi:hypothetical protein
MRRFLVIASAAVVLSGCGSVPERDRNILIGTGVGAGVGAAIGSATGNLLLGAAIGGATGGVVGYLIRPEGCYYRNRQGELWQVSCEGKFAGNAACYVGNDIVGLRQVPCPHARRS